MDLEYLLWLQNLRQQTGDVLTPLMHFVSKFTAGAGCVVIMALLYWCVSKQAGTLMLFNVASGRIVNQLLKGIFCVYRPWVRDTRIVPAGDAIETATGYSFPSGHTQMATSFFGTIAQWQRRRRRWLAWVCIGCILLVGFSRNYLGVHTPQDVIVSIAATAVLLALNERLLGWVAGGPRRDLVVVAGGTVFCAASLAYLLLKPYPMDYVDGVLLVDPAETLEECCQAAGICLGALYGWLWERRAIRFRVEGTLCSRVLRGAVGLVLAALLYRYGMQLSDAALGELAGSLAGWFVLVLFISAIYPLLFTRIRARRGA